mmetsp:Transcript_20602/g.32944  ORF Transcript_20602/g.32944 Transcript_20602/m.32944 type:complete len:83 (-) Transcript_20602:435-683(-)
MPRLPVVSAHNFLDSSRGSFDGSRIKKAHITKRHQQSLDFRVEKTIEELRVLKQHVDVFFTLQTLAPFGVSIQTQVYLLTPP